MLTLMNRILQRAMILMDEAGGGTGGSGGAGSLLADPGGGGGTPPNPTDGGTGTPPNPNGGGTDDKGGGNPPAGAPPTDWRSALPKELQEDGSIKRFKSIADLAAGYANAHKLISGDKMPVPNKNWTDADWQNFYKKAGVPEKVEDYAVKFKDNVTVDPEFAKQFQANAHKLGVLPKQAQALADWFTEMTATSETKFLNERKAEYDKQVADLRKEWGNAFNLNIQRANKLIQDMGAYEHFQKMGYGSDPTLMKYLAKAAEEKYTDPSIFENGSGGGAPARTPAEIDAEIARMMSDPAYISAHHPGHKAAVEQMAALHQEKYPTKKS